MKTIEDLYKFIQTIDFMSECWVHTCPGCDEIGIGVYDTKRQCNFIRLKDDLSVMNVVFYPEENKADLVRVKSGVADYDRPVQVSFKDQLLYAFAPIAPIHLKRLILEFLNKFETFVGNQQKGNDTE